MRWWLMEENVNSEFEGWLIWAMSFQRRGYPWIKKRWRQWWLGRHLSPLRSYVGFLASQSNIGTLWKRMLIWQKLLLNSCKKMLLLWTKSGKGIYEFEVGNNSSSVLAVTPQPLESPVTTHGNCRLDSQTNKSFFQRTLASLVRARENFLGGHPS